VVLAICVQCLPVEPKFRQLQAQQTETSVEIQAISARITFLEKLNKLTYDTTLFTRKLRWLLRRSLTEKPSVAEVAELMNKELEISKAQIEVAVEGVADELKLEVKQGIIALKAGLAFIEDNYKTGSNPEADAIIAKIKANLTALEARFGKKTGEPVVVPIESTGEAPPVEQSTAVIPPVEQSTAAVPPVEQSTAEVPPVEQSTAAAPVETSTAGTPAPQSTGGSLIASESTAEVPPVEASTSVVPPVEASTSVVPPVEASTGGAAQITLEGSSGLFNATNSTSSSTGEGPLAESSLSATAPASTFF